MLPVIKFRHSANIYLILHPSQSIHAQASVALPEVSDGYRHIEGMNETPFQTS